MSKVRFLSVFVLLMLLLSTSVGMATSPKLPLAQVGLDSTTLSQMQDTDLQPGVWEFIADTYLAHSVEYPDENEPVQLLRAYLDGQELLRQNRTSEALTLFQRTVKEFPKCRHAHAGLGSALWQQYESSQHLTDLRTAVQEFTRAAEISLSYKKVRYTGYLWQGLAQLEDAAAMNDFFQRALQIGDAEYLTLLDYARGLAALADPRAEDWFVKAVAVQPTGNIDALAYYAEWLLAQGREADVPQIISSDEHIEYLHFLRGVALEQLGRVEDAKREYAKYIEFNLTNPAPDEFRIPDSIAQEGIVFEGDIAAPFSSCNGYNLLANVIECEATGENEGGQRAVGWTVRTRVFKGSVPSCVYVDDSGSTLSCKYDSVITQSYQFAYSCGRSPGPTERHVRYDVWYGLAPDPVDEYCPSGYYGNACSGSSHCYAGSTYGASNSGPMRFYSTTSDTCTTGSPYSCLTSNGQTCSNGGSDHCFYSRP